MKSMIQRKHVGLNPVDKIFIEGAYDNNLKKLQSKQDIEEKNILDGPLEILFTRGACHVYAARLKNTVPCLDLKRLKSAVSSAAHVYAFWKGMAIDVIGIRTEKELLDSWNGSNGEQYTADMVDCEKLLKIYENRENGKDYNIYGQVASASYIREAILKADAHISANLNHWLKDSPEFDVFLTDKIIKD